MLFRVFLTLICIAGLQPAFAQKLLGDRAFSTIEGAGSPMQLPDDEELKLVRAAFSAESLAYAIGAGKRVTVTLRYVMVSELDSHDRVRVMSEYVVNEGNLAQGHNHAEINGTFLNSKPYSLLTNTHYALQIQTPIDAKQPAPTRAVESNKKAFLEEYTSRGIEFVAQSQDFLQKPVITPQHLSAIFSKNHKVNFSVTWNADTHDPIATSEGPEGSKPFEKLSKSKLFALAFADLYLIDRDRLDQAATDLLASDERLTIKIYFQRYADQLDSYGDRNHTQNKVTEAWCMRWFLNRSHLAGVDLIEFTNYCAPAIKMELVRTKPGQADRVVPLQSMTRTLYGPGTGKKLIDTEQVLQAILLVN